MTAYKAKGSFVQTKFYIFFSFRFIFINFSSPDLVTDDGDDNDDRKEDSEHQSCKAEQKKRQYTSSHTSSLSAPLGHTHTTAIIGVQFSRVE